MNPYLLIASVLGAALAGIEDETAPPAPITGNAYLQDLPEMPTTWETAIASFEASEYLTRFFEPGLIRNLLLTKKQEKRYMAELNAQEQVDIYLSAV